MHNPDKCPGCGADMIGEIPMRGTRHVSGALDMRYDAEYACGAWRYTSVYADPPGDKLEQGYFRGAECPKQQV